MKLECCIVGKDLALCLCVAKLIRCRGGYLLFKYAMLSNLGDIDRQRTESLDLSSEVGWSCLIFDTPVL